MTKLSDTQRVILSAAAQHEMGLARAPKTLPAAARNAVFRSLIKANLLTEINAPREHVGLGWRQDEQTGGTFTITLSGGSGNGKVSFDTEGCRVVPESGAIGDTYSVTVTAQEGAGYALTVNHAADGGYAHASTLRSGSAQLAAQSAQRAQNLRRQQEPRPSANEADTLLLICGVLLIGIVAILTLIVGRKAFRRR